MLSNVHETDFPLCMVDVVGSQVEAFDCKVVLATKLSSSSPQYAMLMLLR